MTERASPPAAPPRLAKNFVYSTISAASAGLLFLLNVLAAHVLPGDDFGKFSWALFFAMIGESLMDFGVHQVTVRAIARDPAQAPKLLHNSLALKAVPGVLMFAVMAALAYAFKADPATRLMTLLMLGSAVLRSYLLTVRGVLLGLERFGPEMVVVVLDRLLLLAGGAFALVGGYGLIGLGVAFVGARAVTVAASLALVHRIVGGLTLKFDLALWRDLQQRALPIGAMLVALGFYSYIDSVMLGVLLNPTRADREVALYAAAYRLYEGLSYVPAILSAVLSPRLARLWGTDRSSFFRLMRNGLGAAVGFAVILAVPMWFIARPLLSFAFNGTSNLDFGSAELAFRILVSGLGFLFLIWILHAVAISTFNEKLLLRTTMTGCAINAGLNLFLIPRYARDGAAFATLTGEAVTVVLLVYGLRHVLRGRAAGV